MRKTCFLHMRKKGADQLPAFRAADLHLCFCYINRAIPLLPQSDISSLCCAVIRFVSEPGRKPQRPVFLRQTASCDIDWFDTKHLLVLEMERVYECDQSLNQKGLELNPAIISSPKR